LNGQGAALKSALVVATLAEELNEDLLRQSIPEQNVRPEGAGGSSRRASVRAGEFGHAFTQGPMDAASHAQKALARATVACRSRRWHVNESSMLFPRRQAGAPGAVWRAPAAPGTSADVGWDNDLDAALAGSSRTGPSRSTWTARFRTHAGKEARRYFANICSFG